MPSPVCRLFSREFLQLFRVVVLSQNAKYLSRCRHLDRSSRKVNTSAQFDRKAKRAEATIGQFYGLATTCAGLSRRFSRYAVEALKMPRKYQMFMKMLKVSLRIGRSRKKILTCQCRG
ncbi:hypothetical protein KIN20_030617 [Parelaphostrongylus tenuis]|uniref:Uncharacterized protein n=1 Tax=Parelaphostrongylus tenuis TaxID=148309 RepID=A0AAD5R548_PARTN|nr:hypothetical protein KIN20_030617 [Parelaphostrongylus tenuis]